MLQSGNMRAGARRLDHCALCQHGNTCECVASVRLWDEVQPARCTVCRTSTAKLACSCCTTLGYMMTHRRHVWKGQLQDAPVASVTHKHMISCTRYVMSKP